MDLNSRNVFRIFLDCHRREGEFLDDFKLVRAITATAFLHTGRLENHKPDIVSMLRQLPDGFHTRHGNGMSFFEAGKTNDGHPWSNSSREIEALLMLGMGIGAVECPVPRKLWRELPGGVPYYCVTV